MSVTSRRKVCTDCFPDLGKDEVLRFRPRPAPHPGPRCVSHHRDRKKLVDKARHEAYVLKTYGLKAGEYDALYRNQGGACYICQRAKGTSKKLAVDHDHATGYVRGLLCGPCNKLLGHVRDDPRTLARAADYLTHPPAHRFIGLRKPDAV